MSLRSTLTAAAVAAGVSGLVGAGAATAVPLITGAQIKNGTVGLVDLKPGTIQALRGRVGPSGPAGPAGPAGAIGTPGGFDPNKITYVTGPWTPIAAFNLTALYATCPTGTKVLGGGWGSSMGYPFAAYSIDGLSWKVQIDNFDGVIEGSGYAWAVCAAA